MIDTIETQGAWARPMLGPVSLGRRFVNFESLRHLISCTEAISYALVRQRVLSTIALCSIVWLASIWLAAAIAQAQELPRNDSHLNTAEPAIGRQSLEKARAPHLLLSMADHTHFEPPTSVGTFAVQSASPRPTDASCQNIKNVLAGNDAVKFDYIFSSNLYASLTEGPLLNARGRDSTQNVAVVAPPFSSRGGEADATSLTKDDGAFVYRFGTVNLVVNRLPNSFSVSSLGPSLPGTR
jgi:hypothetical protein